MFRKGKSAVKLSPRKVWPQVRLSEMNDCVHNEQSKEGGQPKLVYEKERDARPGQKRWMSVMSAVCPMLLCREICCFCDVMFRANRILIIQII